MGQEVAVKVTMGKKSLTTYLNEKEMTVLQLKVDKMNTYLRKDGEPETWDILSEIIYSVLQSGLEKICYEYESSQAVGAAQEMK